MVRTLWDVRLCCLDFLFRSMSSRPISSSLDSLLSMATVSSLIVPQPEQETDTLNTGLCLWAGTHQLHQQVNPTKLCVKQYVNIKLPEKSVLSSSYWSSQELPVSEFLSPIKTQVSSSFLRDLICIGQTSSSAGRLRLVHWDTVRRNNQYSVESVVRWGWLALTHYFLRFWGWASPLLESMWIFEFVIKIKWSLLSLWCWCCPIKRVAYIHLTCKWPKVRKTLHIATGLKKGNRNNSNLKVLGRNA